MPTSFHLRELNDAARFAQRPDLADDVRACGLSGRALPLWGLAAVETGPCFYEPNPHGTFALITAAFDEAGGLVDLVATSLASRAMRRRQGEAVVLGRPMIEQARALGEPLCVFADGLSWLRAGCLGIVILDFDRVGPLLDDVAGFAVQHDLLAARLKRVLERPRPIAPLFVPAKESRP